MSGPNILREFGPIPSSSNDTGTSTSTTTRTRNKRGPYTHKKNSKNNKTLITDSHDNIPPIDTLPPNPVPSDNNPAPSNSDLLDLPKEFDFNMEA